MGVKKLAKQVLSQKENMRYQFLLAGKRTDYGQWLERQEVLWREENDRIRPGEADDSDYVFICAARGVLTAWARKSIECYFMMHPDAQLLYGDEDVQGERGRQLRPDGKFFSGGGKFFSPVFKQDWSPDVFDSCFYFGSLVAMRKELFARAQEEIGVCPLQRTEKGNEYLAEDFPEYVGWMRRCVALTDGYERGSRSIGHVAQILFHCESLEERRKFWEDVPYLPKCGRESTASQNPLVSVVIPSRDHPQLLEKCLRAVKDTADGRRLEVIVVDNGSSAKNREEIEKVILDLTDETLDVIYEYRLMEFNFSKMCNLGAEKARGELLLFLNDDVELAVKGCVGRMAALAARPYTGAVGLKLYYPHSRRIQHAGITNLPMGPVHKLQFLEDDGSNGYLCRGNVNVLAVTAACLMIERKKFQEAGGFTEKLQVAFNDVELCFKLYEAGFHNVCMNGCHAYHYESVSRGDDESVEKLERLLEERETLYAMHRELKGVDPYYSIHLNREGLDTRIRPAYETAGNTVQEYDKPPAEQTLHGSRRDECVMVRIEAVNGGEIYGWSVVLGDNNACYEKALMLKKASETFSPEGEEWFREPNGVYVVALEGQYRPDLQENMPDQVNVALCGFHLNLKANLLPPGRYRLGVSVRHRITGARLMNWSNRCVNL